MIDRAIAPSVRAVWELLAWDGLSVSVGQLSSWLSPAAARKALEDWDTFNAVRDHYAWQRIVSGKL